MPVLRHLALIPVAFCVLFACSKKEKTAATGSTSIAEDLARPLDLSKAVVAKPASLVSVNANLDLEFDRQLAPPHLQGQLLNKNPFTFTPGIAGRAQWLGGNAIRFVPDDPLPAGQSFQAVFNGKVALGEQRNVNDYAFGFKVAEQEILEVDGDFVPDSAAGKTHYEGVLTFAQAIDPGKLGKDLAIEGPQGGLDFRLEAADAPNRVRVVTKALDRITMGRNFRFILPAKYTVNAGPWKRDVFLAGKEVFRAVANEEMSDPDDGELSYGIRFSEPIKEGMDLTGFIDVNPKAEYRVQIQGKYLKLKGKFEPGQIYQATLATGFPSAYGNKLPQNYRVDMAFTNREPEVKWFSDGVFLPSENRAKLQLKSINIGRFRVEVKEIFSGNLGFFLQSNGLGSQAGPKQGGYEDGEGDYFYDPGTFNDMERVGKTVFRKDFPLDAPRNKWLKSELDLAKVFEGKKGQAYILLVTFEKKDLLGKCRNERDSLAPGDLFYENKGYYRNPCNEGFYYGNNKAQKLVLASNTALTLKKTADGVHAFASDVIGAKPASGIKLSLYSMQNQVMATATTDGDGHVYFPLPKEIKTGGNQAGSEENRIPPPQPLYVRGDQDQGLAVIKLDHPAWETSRFEVDGVYGNANGVNAFIYADRGVHRPGDTIHLSAIFRVNRQPPPEKQPILLQLLNARGQQVLETRAQTGPTGQVHFALATQPLDPTGTWTARLRLADQSFDHPLKVETVKPNRLKINMELPDRITATAKGTSFLTGSIDVKYLFGTPAAGLALKANVRINEKPKDFSRFPGFTFEHPVKRFPEQEELLEDKELDAQGRFQLKQPLPSLAKAPGGLQARVAVTVYEKGGGYTERTQRVDIDPYAAYAGVKNPMPGNYARQGETYKVQVVSLDPSGKPLAGRRLKLRVWLNRHYWWWDYDGRDKKDFRTMGNTFLVEEQVCVSEANPLTLKVKLEDEGEHLIEVRDEASGHETGFFLYSSEWGSAAMADRKEKGFVDIGLDKNVYQPGDDGKLTFKSAGQGMALVTFEQGDALLKSFWVEAKAGVTTVPFQVDKGMVPNFYASVSLIQPHNQMKNDLPMRLYGVKPVYVEDGGARLEVDLAMPREIRPDKDFTVTVTSHSREAATFTLAVVDEGLLDLTGFETPNPIAHFFKKIGLNLPTMDNFDEFIGALLPDMDRYFSIGGDEEQRSKRAGSDQGRRFKPVALFEGPLELEPGKSRQIKLHMPNYVGSVRAMLVACSKNGYASREAVAPVLQPVMLLSTVPRVIGPGDRFQVPVSVFAMDSSIREVSVTLTAPKTMEVSGPAEQALAFARPGEGDIAFSLTVGKTLGISPIRIHARAQAGGRIEEADDVTELNVQSPHPFYTRVRDTSVIGNQPLTLVPEKVGIEGSNAASLAFTRIPDLQVQKRLLDLIRYPYGCLEQTVSSVFPQLHLQSLAELTGDEKEAVTRNINDGIRRLADFQMAGKGFSMWPLSQGSQFIYNDWATSYAGHFLLEAKALGYQVPPTLLGNWLGFLESQAKIVNKNDHRLQAYRLFLLAMAGKPNSGAMNLVRENYLKELDPLSRKLLAAAYHESGKKQEAKAIEGQVTTELKTYRELSGTFGSDLRDQAMIAYLCMRMDQPKEGADRLNRVAKRFRESYWYSTQEMGMGLLALGSYYRKYPFTGGDVEFTLAVDGRKAQKLEVKGYQLKVPLKDAWGKNVVITSHSKDPLFISILEEGIPLESRIKDASKGLQLTRNFYDEGGQPMTLADIRKDKAFWVHYRVANNSGQELNELALSSVFPAGWEIASQRVGDQEMPQWVRNLGPQSGKFMDIRDDRINWFFDLYSGGSMDFVAKLNPSFGGEYTLPPVVVEAMYSPEFYGHLAGGRVSVK
ncbi:MAG: alpha-2-macroglobulin family protein [Fibrobacteres bacterium]|nr:alpha-2-macroglobulin family protein [Fibrobacterota bacterium]